MKKIDYLMIENWEDFDVESPMFVLVKAGLSKIEAGGVFVHLMRCLRRSYPDGVTSAENFRNLIELLDLPQDKIDGVMSTSLFVDVDGGNLLFAPYKKQMEDSYDFMSVEVRHMRAVKSGKASGLVPHKGRFQVGNKAACKKKVEKEKTEEGKVEEEKTEESVEENREKLRELGRRLIQTYADDNGGLLSNIREAVEKREI